MPIHLLTYTHYCGHMKFTSTVAKAHKDRNSLRTTIPQPVASLMELEPGTKLEWQIESIDDQMTATIILLKNDTTTTIANVVNTINLVEFKVISNFSVANIICQILMDFIEGDNMIISFSDIIRQVSEMKDDVKENSVRNVFYRIMHHIKNKYGDDFDIYKIDKSRRKAIRKKRRNIEISFHELKSTTMKAFTAFP